MWQEEYNKLSTSDREEYTRLTNIIMSKTFVLRDRFDVREKSTKISRDYRFVERYFELFREYFKVAGWELQKDNNYGVIVLYNMSGTNRMRLDKFTTCILYAIRLIYEEEREKLSLKKDILTSVSDIIKKMISLNIISKKPSDKDITGALSLLRSFNILDKLEGRFEDPETMIIIYPSILFIVTNEKIANIYSIIGEEDEEEDESAADNMEEQE